MQSARMYSPGLAPESVLPSASNSALEQFPGLCRLLEDGMGNGGPSATTGRTHPKRQRLPICDDCEFKNYRNGWPFCKASANRIRKRRATCEESATQPSGQRREERLLSKQGKSHHKSRHCQVPLLHRGLSQHASGWLTMLHSVS